MATTQIQFKLQKETKGAYCFGEVNAAGDIIQDYNNVTIGALYVRKTAISTLFGTVPNILVISIASAAQTPVLVKKA